MSDNNTYAINDFVLCYEPDPLKAKVLYEAKILDIDRTKDEKGNIVSEYYVHFQKWSKNWDRWVLEDQIMEMTDTSKQLQAKLFKEALNPKKRKKKKSECDEEKNSESKTSSLENDEGDESILVSLDIPKPLAVYLEDDCYNIKRKKKLVHLPRRPSVTTLLNDYLRQATTFLKTPDAKIINAKMVGEVVEAVNTYFNFFLSTLLLYNFENEQYERHFPPNKPDFLNIQSCASSPFVSPALPFSRQSSVSENPASLQNTPPPSSLRKSTRERKPVLHLHPGVEDIKDEEEEEYIDANKMKCAVKTEIEENLKESVILCEKTVTKCDEYIDKKAKGECKNENLNITKNKNSEGEILNELVSRPKVSRSENAKKDSENDFVLEEVENVTKKNTCIGTRSIINEEPSETRNEQEAFTRETRSMYGKQEKITEVPCKNKIAPLYVETSMETRSHSGKQVNKPCAETRSRRSIHQESPIKKRNSLSESSLESSMETRLKRAKYLESPAETLKPVEKVSESKVTEKNIIETRLRNRQSETPDRALKRSSCESRASVEPKRGKVEVVKSKKPILPLRECRIIKEETDDGVKGRKDEANEDSILPAGSSASSIHKREHGVFVKYPQNKDGESPAHVYGLEHLLRLFVRLPVLLSATNIDEQRISLINKCLNNMMEYLVQRKEIFSSEVYSESVI